MKFLLAVMYVSSQRHSNRSETFNKNRTKFEYIFMTILGLARLFKTMMNRPDPTRSDPARHEPIATLFDGLFLEQYKK